MSSDELPDTSALAKLSYELSLRTLSQQESSLWATVALLAEVVFWSLQLALS